MAEEVKTAAKRNDASDDDLIAVIRECEAIDEDILSERGAYMAAAKRLREKKNDTIDAASDRLGITKKAIKAKLRERATLAKADRIRSDLEDHDAIDFKRLTEALGDLADTPLGQAATAAAE